MKEEPRDTYRTRITLLEKVQNQYDNQAWDEFAASYQDYIYAVLRHMNIPYEDAEVAVQTGELDGMAWSGITEDYTVGWAEVTDYFLTNNISGAWIGSWFVNQQQWADLPDHLKQLVMAATEERQAIQVHYQPKRLVRGVPPSRAEVRSPYA